MDVTDWLGRQEAIGQCVQRTSDRLPLFDHQVPKPLLGACLPPRQGLTTRALIPMECTWPDSRRFSVHWPEAAGVS